MLVNEELYYLRHVGGFAVLGPSDVACGCAPCTVNRYLVHCIRRKKLWTDLKPAVTKAIVKLLNPFEQREISSDIPLPTASIGKAYFWVSVAPGRLISSQEYGETTWKAVKSLPTHTKELLDYISRCASCRKKFTSADVFTLPSDGQIRHFAQICQACRLDGALTRECGWCDQAYICDANSFYDNRQGYLVCNYCQSFLQYCHPCRSFNDSECTECNRETGLHRYDYKPRFKYLTATNESRDYRTLFTGVELEMGHLHDDIQDSAIFVNKQRGMYAVHDGSITQEGSLASGLELITMPFSREYWYEELRETLDDTLTTLKSKYNLEAYKHKTCGMHIHLSRASFTSARLYKFLYMLIKNPSWSCDVGQRIEDDWALRYCSFSKEGKTIADIVHKAQQGMDQPIRDRARGERMTHNMDKYVAVNTNNNRSIEIRIFKGTLNPIAIQKNLEFCWALYDWTGGISNEEINLPSFLAFIDENRKEYMALFDFLCATKQYPTMKTNAIKQFRGD